MNEGRVMNRMIDSLGMLLLSCALLAVGNHLLNVLIPLRLNEAEVETLLIGVVMSANAVGIVLGCFYGKLLVIRVGYVRTFVLSCTLFTAVVLTYALFTNAYAWLVLRVLGGFFTATAYVVVESWLNSSSSVENRGQVLGWYLVVHYAATATLWSTQACCSTSSTGCKSGKPCPWKCKRILCWCQECRPAPSNSIPAPTRITMPTTPASCSTSTPII